MGSTVGRMRRLAAGVCVALTLVVALALPAVALATPAAPTVKDATLHQGGAGVTLWWAPSTDSEAGTLVYSVYRANVPMTAANYTLKELVTYTGSPMGPGTWVGETTVTVAPAAAEASAKFTYYYLVEVLNTTTGKRAISANIAPNVHGGSRTGFQTFNCQLCHSVHGAPPENYLGAATRYKCYRCHGATSTATVYGDKAVVNVQRDFYDYTGQPGADAASRHFNAQNVADQRECTMCHFKYPHNSPYYVDPATGLYDAAKSYSQLLYVKRADATVFASKDSAPAGNVFCLECHGVSTTTLDYNAGAGAYASQAGDHTYAASAAHSTASVFANGLDTNPGIQCEACHNKHASAADKLIAYRGDDTRGADVASGTYAQAELCFACHSAAGYAAEIAAGTSAGAVNFAWNGRDVKAQFGKVSHHPTVARAGGPIAEAGQWTQTSQADFAGDTLVNAMATAAGSVTLEPLTTSNTFLNETFTSGWGSWTTTGSYWTVASGYANWQHLQTTRQTGTAQRTLDFSTALADPTVTFNMGTTGLDAGEDYYIVQYSVNGGAWQDLVASTATARTWPAAMGPYTLTGAAGSSNVRLLFTASTMDNTTEWIRFDDIVVTGPIASGTYLPSGTAVSTQIAAPGTLASWGTLAYNASVPAGTGITVDVLNATDDSELQLSAPSGYDLNADPDLAGVSAIKLRANLAGNAVAPRTATDDYNDNSFNTSLWGNVYMGSSDPDAASTVAWSDTTDFASSWGGWTPTGSYWSIAAGYASWAPDQVAQQVGYFERTFDFTNITNPQITFNMGTLSMEATEDYYRVQYSVNGGAWQTLAERTDGTDVTWSAAMGPYALTGAGGSNNVAVRFTAALTDDSFTPEYVRYDTIVVSGTQNLPATNLWPSETGGQLTLRAEGTGFGRTSAVPGTAITDEGAFTYVAPASADWVDTQDFDMVVRVPSYNNLGGNGWMKAGLMVRTGTTEANAYAANAAMIGLYVSDTNGVVFQSRTTAGGIASANAAGTGDAPVYLKLTRRGNVFTGYKSTDGTSWTQVGTATVTTSTYVLPGVSLTSGLNGTFSEATFDAFSITEAGITSTATPALLDWTVSYMQYPPVVTGSLTCANCHNVHVVQKGTAGVAWQLVRASLPSNTKAAPTTPTALCLDCHDGTPPTTTANSATILVPYAVEFSDKSALLLFPGWNKSETGADWGSSGHKMTAIKELTGDMGCETCHDPHASDNVRLTAYTFDESGANATHTGTVVRNNTSTYAEQNLCYTCHGSTKTGMCNSAGCHAIALAFLNTQTPFAGTYRHPVSDFNNGRHADTEVGTDLGPATTDRHAECADCHDPHATRAGVHPNTTSTTAATKSSNPGEALRGATGIKPVYGTAFSGTGDFTTMNKATSFTAARMTGEAGDFEAYVCLKCHSSYSGQPFSITSNTRTYTSTDLALEFNPSNQSEHNVFGQMVGMESAFTVNGTTYDMPLPADSAFLKTGWTHDSAVTCTDCHTNTTAGAARGPHGSSTPWMIATGYVSWSTTTNLNNLNTAVGGQYIICTKCHQNLSTSNYAHEKHTDRATCMNCHIKVPHGWKRPRLLVSSNDPAYLSSNGRIGQGISLRTHSSPDDWVDNSTDCAGGCDGRHNLTGPFWP